MQSTRKCDSIVVKDGWITCPECGRNHRLLRITPETEAHGLPVYCRTCRREIVLNIERGQSQAPEPMIYLRRGWIVALAFFCLPGGDSPWP